MDTQYARQSGHWRAHSSLDLRDYLKSLDGETAGNTVKIRLRDSRKGAHEETTIVLG